MSETKKFPTKLVVGGIAIVAVLAILYFFVFNSASSDIDSNLQVASSTNNLNSDDGSEEGLGIDTDRILRQLNDLRRIRINTDFFSSPAFLSLLDFSVTINPQPIGRENPFIPSTYVPSGASIVPRANPSVPQAVGTTSGNGGIDTPESAENVNATTTTATSSGEVESSGN